METLADLCKELCDVKSVMLVKVIKSVKKESVEEETQEQPLAQQQHIPPQNP